MKSEAPIQIVLKNSKVANNLLVVYDYKMWLFKELVLLGIIECDLLFLASDVPG